MVATLGLPVCSECNSAWCLAAGLDICRHTGRQRKAKAGPTAHAAVTAPPQSKTTREGTRSRVAREVRK